MSHADSRATAVQDHADDGDSPPLTALTSEQQRRERAAQRLADYIKATVAAAPDLTTEQRSELAVLLAPGGGPRDTA